VLGVSEGLGSADRACVSGADWEEKSRSLRAATESGSILRVLEEVFALGGTGWTWEESWSAGLSVYTVADGSGARVVIAQRELGSAPGEPHDQDGARGARPGRDLVRE
jgi:hypothetical protein